MQNPTRSRQNLASEMLCSANAQPGRPLWGLPKQRDVVRLARYAIEPVPHELVIDY